jgi:hypothetical protein
MAHRGTSTWHGPQSQGFGATAGYYAEPFEAPSWRAEWVNMPES